MYFLCCQMTKSVTCPEELGGLASQVTVDYGQLAHQGRLAAATAESEEVRRHALCPMEYMREKKYLRSNKSRSFFWNSAPEISVYCKSSFLNKNSFSYVFTHTLIRADGCWEITLLPQGCSPTSLCEIKQKCTLLACIALIIHVVFSVYSGIQKCVEAFY